MHCFPFSDSCSLVIPQVLREDIGRWQCDITFDNGQTIKRDILLHEQIKSDHTHIRMVLHPILHPFPDPGVF